MTEKNAILSLLRVLSAGMEPIDPYSFPEIEGRALGAVREALDELSRDIETHSPGDDWHPKPCVLCDEGL